MKLDKGSPGRRIRVNVTDASRTRGETSESVRLVRTWTRGPAAGVRDRPLDVSDGRHQELTESAPLTEYGLLTGRVTVFGVVARWYAAWATATRLS
jgi:hypothetical protein